MYNRLPEQMKRALFRQQQFLKAIFHVLNCQEHGLKPPRDVTSSRMSQVEIVLHIRRQNYEQHTTHHQQDVGNLIPYVLPKKHRPTNHAQQYAESLGGYYIANKKELESPQVQ
jgi:hypothetical protein